MKYSRREFAGLAAAAFAAPLTGKMINSTFGGVMVGAQTYSFRDLSVDDCIAAMAKVGLGYAELYQGHVEPKGKAALKRWRDAPPYDQLKEVRRKFDDAGIVLYAFNYSFQDSFSDLQIENGFKMAQAMGVDKITASANVDMGDRIDKYAKVYKVYVGCHNHDSMKPNEFSTPADWEKIMRGRSEYIKINLDIGHFTAANFDPVSFLEQHHSDILTLHIKDRGKNHGPAVPFGQGQTPIRQVLQLLKTKHYHIPAMIEYEYGEKGMDDIAEVRKCFDYVKAALA